MAAKANTFLPGLTLVTNPEFLADRFQVDKVRENKRFWWVQFREGLSRLVNPVAMLTDKCLDHFRAGSPWYHDLHPAAWEHLD